MIELPNTHRIRLHALLREVAEPWLDAAVEPVIISWYQQRSPHQYDKPFGMFRFQYGSRVWTTGGFPFTGNTKPAVPSYEAEFEKLACTLRAAKWFNLGMEMLLPSGLSTDVLVQPEIEMFLFIDKVACHFGARNTMKKKEEYFLVTPDGLEPDPTSPKVWFDSWPGQHTTPIFRPRSMPKEPNRANSQEVAQHVKWWYQTPHMPVDEATKRLGTLMIALFARLSALGKSVAIASSPHRFNDACGDDNWLAAIVDGQLWENGVYFRSSAETLARSPRALHEAMGILQYVLTTGIRQRLAEFLGSECVAPDTLVLSSDERGFLIALSLSTAHGGPVYLIDPESGLPTLVGVAPRLDWRFSECAAKNGEAHTKDSAAHVVQFIPLSEWVGQLSGGKASDHDFPKLTHI